MDILIIGLSIVSIILLYIVVNLYRKCVVQERILEGYLTYLEEISKIIEASDVTLKDLDSRGVFKSDDEIGNFFQTVLDIQKVLNNFVVKEE